MLCHFRFGELITAKIPPRNTVTYSGTGQKFYSCSAVPPALRLPILPALPTHTRNVCQRISLLKFQNISSGVFPFAESNLTALSVGDAIFLSKSCWQESPSQLLSCFAALNWYYDSTIGFGLQDPFCEILNVSILLLPHSGSNEV